MCVAAFVVMISMLNNVDILSYELSFFLGGMPLRGVRLTQTLHMGERLNKDMFLCFGDLHLKYIGGTWGGQKSQIVVQEPGQPTVCCQ